MPRPHNDLTDLVVERLTVLGRDYNKSSKKNAYWFCQCICGNITSVSARNLRKHTRSCGCLRKELGKLLPKGRPLIHGANRKGQTTPEYKAWQKLKERCLNPTCKDYPRYGGRGIQVCDRWRDSFSAFLEDIGPRPSPNHSLDRYPDGNGPYSPENCRWATRKEQARNTRNNVFLTWNDETHCISEWSEIVHISQLIIADRHRRHWPVERILTTPPRRWPSEQ